MKKLRAYLQELEGSAERIKGYEVIWVNAVMVELVARAEYDEGIDDDDRNMRLWAEWFNAKRIRLEAEIDLHRACNRALDARAIVEALAPG